MRAELPAKSLTLTSAPLVTKVLTISNLPYIAAKIRGVFPKFQDLEIKIYVIYQLFSAIALVQIGLYVNLCQERLNCAQAYSRMTVCRKATAKKTLNFHNQSQNSIPVEITEMFCGWLKSQYITGFSVDCLTIVGSLGMGGFHLVDFIITELKNHMIC